MENETKYFLNPDTNETCKGELFLSENITGLDDPRKEFDTKSTVSCMYCWSRNYALGDEHEYADLGDLFLGILSDFSYGHNMSGLNPKKKADPDFIIEYLKTHKLDTIAKFEVIDNDTFAYLSAETDPEEITDDHYSKHDLLAELLDPFETPLIREGDRGRLDYSAIFGIFESKNFPTELSIEQINMYDHSGISLYIGDIKSHFDYLWDCSPVGVNIYSKDLFEEITGKENAPDWLKQAQDEFKSDLEKYNDYLSGDVWELKVTDNDLDESYVGPIYGSEFNDWDTIKKNFWELPDSFTEITEAQYEELTNTIER
ncbi:MAG: hypothetical protein J6O00_10555 [Clostridiales bacterium]|nr:hypothetical protein [Clostridiales bacterium]